LVLRAEETEITYGTPLVVGNFRVTIDPAVAATPEPKTGAADGALRREIHRRLLDFLDLARLDASKLDDPSTRPRVLAGLRSIIQAMGERIPPSIDRDVLLG